MDLFVYGSLRSRDLMTAVAGAKMPEPLEAVLNSYRVGPVRGDVVPAIVSDKNGAALGAVWRDLTNEQMARLDLYEGAFGYELAPVTVDIGGTQERIQCYLPPENIDIGRGEWSLSKWEENHLRPAILAAEELFSQRPFPDHGALRRMWPMIEARAWAKHRAAAAPSEVRRAATGGDFRIVASRPPHGSFYRLQSLDVTYQRFDDTRSHLLVREAFFGVDAALVLPYDPVRDKVALIEQVRMGPAARLDPNPWMLEPIAGIVDARETPLDAALREAREEAGLEITHLEPAGQYYPSPGGSTDYFYTFVGLCDLPENAPYLGGLDDEAEDLRIHPLSFDAAIGLAQSGEIATGPLLQLLYWLAFHRERLRGAD